VKRWIGNAAETLVAVLVGGYLTLVGGAIVLRGLVAIGDRDWYWVAAGAWPVVAVVAAGYFWRDLEQEHREEKVKARIEGWNEGFRKGEESAWLAEAGEEPE
jgi:hypothetical protein